MRHVLAAMTLCLVALPAQAGFHVCNKAPREVKVALGYFDGVIWASRGWWNIPPGTCRTLIDRSLDSRFYYLYASDNSTGIWDGKRVFCVASASDTFQIKGRGDCEAHGFDRRGFFEIDTGQTRDYTQNLSD